MGSATVSPAVKPARSCSKLRQRAIVRFTPSTCSTSRPLRAVPDQLVTYFFWGEDVGSGRAAPAQLGRHVLCRGPALRGDLPPRRAATGADQPRTSNRKEGRTTPAIPTNWPSFRRRSSTAPGSWCGERRGPSRREKLAEDGKVLKEAQQSAIEKADQLAERLQDAASKASLEQATRLMKDAEKRLTEVADNASITGAQSGTCRRAGCLPSAAQAASSGVSGDSK